MMARARFSSFALALCVACFSYLTTLAQEIVTPGIGSDTNGSEQGSDQSSDQTKASGSANTAKAVSTSAAAAAIALLNEGLADLKRRDFKAALAAFEKAIAAMPDYAAAYAERGGAHIGLGANDKAVTDLTKALHLMGGTGDATERGRLHGNRGLAYLNQSKHEPAVADFDKAIELDPKLAFAYANRGMSHMQRKNYDAALRDASRAVELRPNYEFALLVRGYVQNDKQMFSEAAADFTKILRSSPTNRGAILGLRQAYQAGRQQEEPAKIKLVRLADPFCEPSCPEWLAIEGKIEAGAAETFKELVQKLDKRKLAVFVDSGGGSVSDAMEMGRLIRAKGLDVVVTRTELVGCGKDDAACKKRVANGRALGRPFGLGAICASSCGFLLASGVRRYVGPSSLVGVHQITSFQTYQKVYRQYEVQRAYRGGKIVEIDRRIVSETRGAKKTVQTATSDETYVKIRKYFAEMGVAESIMPLLIGAPPKGMHWLSDAELKATEIRTDTEQGEQLIARGAVGRVGLDGSNALPATSVAAIVDRKTTPPPAVVVEPDVAALTRQIQVELTRIGCAPGAEDGKWGQGVRRGLERYNVLTGKPLKTNAPLPETLIALQSRSGLVCPPACPPDMTEPDGQCVARKPVRADDIPAKSNEPDKPAKVTTMPPLTPPAALTTVTKPPTGAPASDTAGVNSRLGEPSLSQSSDGITLTATEDAKRAKPTSFTPSSTPGASAPTRDSRRITAAGADRACSNFETSCSAALSYCLSNCRERGSGGRCFQDCSGAVSYCRSSGTWRTTNCLKTGMTR